MENEPNQQPVPQPTPPPVQPEQPQQPPQYPQAAPPTPAPAQAIKNPLSVMQPGEQMICQIKRHPIGIIGVYISGLVVLFLMVAGIAVLPQLIPNVSSQMKTGAFLLFVVVLAIVGLYTYIARVVYLGNSWIVTSDSITQVTQVSLFSKQSSQLSLANLEDITVEQNGIIQSIFGFGTLRAETAGERSKFMFPYCPNPNSYAQQILNAREQFEQFRGGRGGVNVNGE